MRAQQEASPIPIIVGSWRFRCGDDGEAFESESSRHHHSHGLDVWEIASQ